VQTTQRTDGKSAREAGADQERGDCSGQRSAIRKADTGSKLAVTGPSGVEIGAAPITMDSEPERTRQDSLRETSKGACFFFFFFFFFFFCNSSGQASSDGGTRDTRRGNEPPPQNAHESQYPARNCARAGDVGNPSSADKKCHREPGSPSPTARRAPVNRSMEPATRSAARLT